MTGFSIHKNYVSIREFAEIVFVHFRIQIRLRSIDLIYKWIIEYIFSLRSKRNHQADIVLFREFRHRLHLIRISRTENNIHVLHLSLLQNLVNRSSRLSTIVCIQINGYTNFLQTIQCHQETFVIFHHTDLFFPCTSTIGIERQYNSRLDRRELLVFLLVLVEQLGICQVGFRILNWSHRCLRTGFLSIRNTEELAFLQFLVLDFRIGSKKFFFRNAIHPTYAIYRFLAFHLVHIPTFRFQRFALLRSLYLRCFYRSLFLDFSSSLSYRRDGNHLTDTEILDTQSRIGTADAFYRYTMLYTQLIEGFSSLYRMEYHLILSTGLRDLQCLAYLDTFIATRIQLHNLRDRNIIHAGNGI